MEYEQGAVCYYTTVKVVVCASVVVSVCVHHPV